MKKIFTPILIVALFTIASCESFLELDAPVTQVSRQQVFSTDAGVKSALAGVLAQLTDDGAFASGGLQSVTVLAGLSSDELVNYSSSPDYVALSKNAVAPTSSIVSSNWRKMYGVIYQVNSIIEGLEAKQGSVSAIVQRQSLAEAKFLRAFTYFYLVNLFGDVPLILGTDYRVNRVIKRSPTSEVYNQILADLKAAEADLPLDYSMSQGERVHPNSRAATALMARTYLYLGRWAEAEQAANKVIGDDTYQLVDLSDVFLTGSGEAIWQLVAADPAFNTIEGSLMILEFMPSTVGLSPQLPESFEAGDARKDIWTGIYTSSEGETYPYAYKYKVFYQYEPITEYYMMLRLAEQYLLRGEARIRQGKITEGIADVNTIRVRAGLSSLDAGGMAEADALLAVESERRFEFFCEWGHRWFDLKRWNRLDAVLAPLKEDWQPKDALFPIPQAEITANPNLTQNQ